MYEAIPGQYVKGLNLGSCVDAVGPDSWTLWDGGLFAEGWHRSFFTSRQNGTVPGMEP